MGLIDWAKSFESKFAWSLFGAVIGLLGLLLAVYLYLHEKKPNLVVEITGESNILDLHKPLEDLDITFQGKNIQKENLNLKIVSVTIKNIGESDILQGQYDVNSIWGLNVINATVIEVRLHSSSDEYLQTHVKPTLLNGTTIQFSKIIFEKDKYFALEILCLHDKNVSPEISPVGKIAGIDRIIPVKSWPDKQRMSMFNRILQGGITVNFLRFVIFGFSFVIALVLVIVATLSIGEQLSKSAHKRREEFINRILLKYKIPSKPYRGIIKMVYIKDGLKGLLEMHRTLTSPLRTVLLKPKEVSSEEIFLTHHLHISELLDAKIITHNEQGDVKIDEDFLAILSKFIEFMQSQSQ